MARTDAQPETRPPYRHLVLVFVALAAIPTLTEGLNPNYAVQVNPITFPREPQSTAVLPNTTASFSCNITAVPLISNYSEPYYPLPIVQWRFNGTATARHNWDEDTEEGFGRLDVHGVGPEDVGYYECLALDGQNYILFNVSFVETWAHTTVSRRAWLELVDLSPEENVTASFVSESHVFEDISINRKVSPTFSIPCPPSGQPIGSVYLYRNGDDITSNCVYNATSGNFMVEIPEGDISSVLGVYQCFAESDVGVAYSITRVFQPNFMNPPGNLTCHAQTDAATGRAEVVLNWERPELFTGRSADNFYLSYIYNHVIIRVGMVGPVSTTITLANDGLYGFHVFSDGARNDAPALCTIQDTIVRITEQENPLSISCAGTPNALWNDPSQKSRRLTTVDVLVNATCIRGNENWQSSTTATDVINVRFLGISEVALTVEDVPSGAVCLFGGYHQYDNEQQTRAIPTDTCIVIAPPPTPPPTVRLGLSCESSEVNVSWFTATSECYRVQNITLQGRCLSYTSQWEYEAFTTSSFVGVRTAGQVASDSVCTFFGFYYDTAGQRQDIEPAQCVGGEPPDERYRLPEASDIADYPTECPTPTPATTGTVTSVDPTSPTTETPPPDKSDDIEDFVWYVLAFGVLLVVAIIVVLLILLLVCVCKRYSSQDRREKEELEDIIQFVKQQVTGTTQMQPQSPVQIDWEVVDVWGRRGWPDVLSIAETEIDFLERLDRDSLGPATTGVTSLVGRPINSLANAGDEADGKRHLRDKFLNSQQDEQWKETDSGTGADCGRGGTAIASGEGNRPTSDGSSLGEESRLFGADLNASKLLQRRMVQLANVSAAGSSGYNSESYYTSDSSGGYPGSSLLGERNYLAEKLTELEEEYPSSSSASGEKSTRVDVADCEGGAPVIEEPSSSESSDRIRVADETVIEIEPEIETPNSKGKPRKLTKFTRTSESRQQHRAESPVLDYSRAPPYYMTDDEGYVHMDSAGHVDIIESS